jgi:two-component system, OmpR family, sensor histidine kinase QseC
VAPDTASPRMPKPFEAGAARPWSLRQRLLLLTALVTATAWLVGGSLMFLIESHESDMLFDQRLRDIASALLTFADHEINELQEAGSDVVHLEGASTLGARYHYQIWSPDGELLLVSVGTTRTPFAPFTESGFSTHDIDGVPMRVLVLPSDDASKMLEVAEPMSARSWHLDAGLAYLFIPLVLSLALLVAIGAWLVRGATRALGESASQVTERSPEDLRPLTIDAPPAELTPILAAVNSLFRRIEDAMSAERRFTAAAAHELRTPLASVKIQAQVALLTPDEAERRAALHRLVASVDGAAHTVDQLLTMSRIDGLIALRTRAVDLELDVVATHVIDEIRPLAARRNQTIVESLDAADIEGLEFGVAVLLRNLLDNAIRYGPVGGKIRVSCLVEDGESVLRVEDAGPGIPPDQRRRVFERFYRLPSTTGVDGCGIGLSIVQAVVELHRAQIELDRSTLGGLMVSVRFPSVGPNSEASRIRETGDNPDLPPDPALAGSVLAG